MTHETEVTVQGNREFAKVKGSAYILPCDKREIERLIAQHRIIKMASDSKNIHVPKSIESLNTSEGKILDMATGSGTWAIEVAREYPNAQVIGVDISDHGFPTHSPPNTRFLRANVLDGLPFEDGAFDLVHQRLLIGALSQQQWGPALTELVRVTRPGGWVQLAEWNFQEKYPESLPNLLWYRRALSQMFQERGFDLQAGDHLEDRARAAGLTNLHIARYPLPIGQSTELGRLNKVKAFESISGMASQLKKHMAPIGPPQGWEGEILDASHVQQIVDEIEIAELEGSFLMYTIVIVCGQRPL
ncbi:uncharacterized protein VTP21DRAFT_893 [Calcarisporiella thermophila]|uniref:uncharacterized protein n=1 Tax=Calcarisporiella thermophila TaxID=911321 RepID=UPI003742CC14